MKAMFNAVCDCCLILRPRCAHVYLQTGNADTGAPLFAEAQTVLCEECRKKRTYRVAEKHRKGGG